MEGWRDERGWVMKWKGREEEGRETQDGGTVGDRMEGQRERGWRERRIGETGGWMEGR